MLATSYSSATEINVETAGTLSSLIGETDKYVTENLTLTGQLNGDDIAFIRDMAGSDRDMNTTEGQLKVLDMSGAHIVGGGGYYFYSKATGATYYTHDNQLGDYMFYDCLPLESVLLPTDITYIGAASFCGCSKLKGIIIPETVTEIGGSAFESCASITEVIVPNAVTAIGDLAFSHADALKIATIGSGVESMDLAFIYCKSLEKFVVSDANAYYTTLDDVLVNKSQTKIVTYPNAHTADYVVPECITEIGGLSFAGLVGMNSITLGSNVATINARAFSYADMREMNLNEGLISVAEYAFMACDSLKAIKLPSTLTQAGTFVFSDCETLKTVELSSGLPTLSKGMFAGCTSLDNLTIPAAVKNTGEYTFQGCSSLSSLTLCEGIDTIGEGCFSDNYSLSSVAIPGSVRILKNLVFSNCNTLKTITFAEGLESIGDYCFSYCTMLESLEMPNTMTNLGEGALSGCTSLKRMKFSDSMQTVKSWMFSYCASLESVDLGNGIETIEDGAFCGCEALTDIILGTNMKTIGQFAFAYCSALSNIDMNEGLEQIGDYAMNKCDLPEVHIPSTVTYVGAAAFSNNENLKEVYVEATVPPTTGKRPFNYIAEEATLHVPAGTIDDYKAADVWKDFFAIYDDIANSVSPINATNQLHIVNGGIEAYGSVSIYTVAGKQVYASKNNQGFVSLLPNMYIIKVNGQTIKAIIR